MRDRQFNHLTCLWLFQSRQVLALYYITLHKCAIHPITKKCNTSFSNYTIFGNTLERVDDHEYPGISISHDLCWEKHCNKITKKASKTPWLLLRTLSPCFKEVKGRARQVLVRPQLEYAAEAWFPYNITTADHLERMQRASARFFSPCLSTCNIRK